MARPMFVEAYPGPVYQISSSGAAATIGAGIQFGGWQIATHTSGNFYLADHFNNCIRMLDKNGHSKRTSFELTCKGPY